MKKFPLNQVHYTPGSDELVFWKYVKPIQAMFGRLLLVTEPIGKTPTRCPYCYGSGPPKRITEENAFISFYPEAAKEWHPTKNGNLIDRKK